MQLAQFGAGHMGCERPSPCSEPKWFVCRRKNRLLELSPASIESTLVGSQGAFGADNTGRARFYF